MPKAERYARIAITLPEQDLATADRLALAYDRSRSWIVAEAIRRYAAALHTPSIHTRRTDHVTGDAATSAAEPAGHPGLGASRLAQLTRDLSLTPEARVREAEETLRLTELREKPRAHRVMAFDAYEDFLEWKATRDRRQ